MTAITQPGSNIKAESQTSQQSGTKITDQLTITNPFLQAHLQYVHNTEPPILMHLWAAIGTAGACMGRHVWLHYNVSDLFANQYILLVGPPGTRKNTAIKYPVRLARNVTDIQFAPDDTAGQRQGLIAAMQEFDAVNEDDQDDLAAAIMSADMDALANTTFSAVPAEDRRVLFAVATEFGSVIGQNNLDMTRFLLKMWDGEDYKYQLKSSFMVLNNPLLSILAGTTTSDLTSLLPQEAMGQGFMSRIILVHGAKKEKSVPRSHVDRDQEPYLESVYRFLFNTLRGEMQESPEAADRLDHIYETKNVVLNDTRFIFYIERRHTHLVKLAMVLAATRFSNVIELQDIEQADAILTATEQHMPEALGEYGLSPLGTARQKLVEFIRSANQPVTDTVLWMVLQRDMKLSDYRLAIANLLNAKKIVEVDTRVGKAYVYNDEIHQTLNALTDDDWSAMLDQPEEGQLAH